MKADRKKYIIWMSQAKKAGKDEKKEEPKKEEPKKDAKKEEPKEASPKKDDKSDKKSTTVRNIDAKV